MEHYQCHKNPWSSPYVGWVKGTIKGKKWFSDYAAAFRGNPTLGRIKPVQDFDKKIQSMCKGKLVRIESTGKTVTTTSEDSKICTLFSNGVAIQKRYFDYAMNHFKSPKFYCAAKEPAEVKSVVIKEGGRIVGCVMKIWL